MNCQHTNYWCYSKLKVLLTRLTEVAFKLFSSRTLDTWLLGYTASIGGSRSTEATLWSNESGGLVLRAGHELERGRDTNPSRKLELTGQRLIPFMAVSVPGAESCFPLLPASSDDPGRDGSKAGCIPGKTYFFPRSSSLLDCFVSKPVNFSSTARIGEDA